MYGEGGGHGGPQREWDSTPEPTHVVDCAAVPARVSDKPARVTGEVSLVVDGDASARVLVVVTWMKGEYVQKFATRNTI